MSDRMPKDEAELRAAVARNDEGAEAEYGQAVNDGQLTEPGPADPFDGYYAE